MMLKDPTDAILQMLSFMLHPPHGPRTLELHNTPMPAIDLFAMLPVLLVAINHISTAIGIALVFVVVGASGQLRNTRVAMMGQSLFDTCEFIGRLCRGGRVRVRARGRGGVVGFVIGAVAFSMGTTAFVCSCRI